MKASSLLNQIYLAMPELPLSEKKVGKFVFESAQDVLYMNIGDIAKKANSSPAAVVRFCKSIGVENFGNLKIILSAELNQNESFEGTELENFDVEDNEPVSHIVEKTLANTIQVFEDTAKQIDLVMVEKIVEMLEKTDMIYIYGIGASFLIAEDIAQKWRRLGKNAYATSDYHLLTTTMAVQNKGAVLWGISYSGMTKEVLMVVEKAKDFGMKTIGLTRMGQNKLAGSVDALITTARAPEAILRSAATTSRFAQLFVIDLIFLTYASKRYDLTKEQLERSREAISDLF